MAARLFWVNFWGQKLNICGVVPDLREVTPSLLSVIQGYLAVAWKLGPRKDGNVIILDDVIYSREASLGCAC